jgi:hypothetical protein
MERFHEERYMPAARAILFISHPSQLAAQQLLFCFAADEIERPEWSSNKLGARQSQGDARPCAGNLSW